LALQLSATMTWKLQYDYDLEQIGGTERCICCNQQTSRCSQHRFNYLRGAANYVVSKAKDSLEEVPVVGGLLGERITDDFTEQCNDCREVAWMISVKDGKHDDAQVIGKYCCTQCMQSIKYVENWCAMGRDLKKLIEILRGKKDDDDYWKSAYNKICGAHKFWKDHGSDLGRVSDHADYQHWNGRINSASDAWGHVETAIHAMGEVVHGFEHGWFS